MNSCSTIIKSLPINRGRESTRHREGKLALGRLLASRGFLVLFEHMLADLVAFRRVHGERQIVCGEHDTTLRNVRSNVRRDFAKGCRSLVILVPNDSARTAVRRLLRREFSRDIQNRIGVITHDICHRQLERLCADFIPPASQSRARNSAQPLNTNSNKQYQSE